MQDVYNTYTYIYIHTHTLAYTYTSLQISLGSGAYIHTCTYRRIHTKYIKYIKIHTNMHKFDDTYTYIHIHTHMHATCSLKSVCMCPLTVKDDSKIYLNYDTVTNEWCLLEDEHMYPISSMI